MSRGPGPGSIENLSGLYDLVEKRINQGLTATLIAQRLGVSYNSVCAIVAEIKRRNNMTVEERIEEIRALIRPRDMKAPGIRAGMQSHQVQDLHMEMVKKLDDLEAELRKGSKKEK